MFCKKCNTENLMKAEYCQACGNQFTPEEKNAAYEKTIFGKFEKLEKYISSCDEEFYERLYFKPYVIRDLNSAAVDRKKFNTYCPNCGAKMRRISKWSFKNAFFRAKFNCDACEKKYKVSLRYKQYYDYVDFKKKVEELVDKKEGE